MLKQSGKSAGELEDTKWLLCGIGSFWWMVPGVATGASTSVSGGFVYHSERSGFDVCCVDMRKYSRSELVGMVPVLVIEAVAA